VATRTLSHLLLLVFTVMVYVSRTYALLLRWTRTTRLVIEGLTQVGLDCGVAAGAVANSCVHIGRSLLLSRCLTILRICAALTIPVLLSASLVMVAIALLSLEWTLQS